MNPAVDPPEPGDGGDPFFGNDPVDILRYGLEGAEEDGWQPPDVASVAELLPQYEVSELLGRGGMGVVYLGMQANLGRRVAIKLLPVEMIENAPIQERFRREAATLAALDHPGIVSIYEFGETQEGHLYLVMEFVEGTTLDHLIRESPLNPSFAISLIVGVCDALNYAHSKGVVHRDIKPSNILISRDGTPKVADFGLARPSGNPEASRLTRVSQIVGTPEYMAPEQYYGQGDHRADIYAVGVMLYEMLTGVRPSGVFDPPSATAPVDSRMDEIVIKAMRREPARRYQVASEMKADIEDVPPFSKDGNGEQGRVPYMAANLQVPWDRLRRIRIVPAFAVAAILSAIVVVVVLIMRSEEVGLASGSSTPAPSVGSSSSPSKDDAEENRQEEIRKFKEVLMGYEWRYVDEGWPESVVIFREDGTFHDRWRWQYWVIGPRVVEVQYNRRPRTADDIVTFEFNDDLTGFTCIFTGKDQKVHRVTGYRMRKLRCRKTLP